MPGFDPNEPRDELGRWTDAGVSAPVQNKMQAGLRQEEAVRSEAELIQKIKDAKEKGLDTLQLYAPDGKWAPEREALHEQIYASYLNKEYSSTDMFFMTGGAPANSKSTVLEMFPSTAMKIDPDEIKAMLPEYGLMTKNGISAASEFVHEESSLVSKELVRRGLAKGVDIIYDTTGDGEFDNLARKVQQAKDAGRTVQAKYVSLSVEQSIKNEASRGAKPPFRRVPMQKLLKDNRDISKLVPQIVDRKLYDDFELYDTNILRHPRLVLSQKGGRTTMHDQKLYNDFLEKANYYQ